MELRSLRGAVAAVPEGTDYLLRGEPAPGLIPAHFRRATGTLMLTAEATEIAEGGGQRVIEPPQGVPEVVVGVVLEIDDDRVIVDAGFPFTLRWPSSLGGPLRAIGATVRVAVQGPVIVSGTLEG